MEDGGLPVMSEDEPDVPDEAFDAEAAAVAAGEAEWQTVTPDEPDAAKVAAAAAEKAERQAAKARKLAAEKAKAEVAAATAEVAAAAAEAAATAEAERQAAVKRQAALAKAEAKRKAKAKRQAAEAKADERTLIKAAALAEAADGHPEVCLDAGPCWVTLTRDDGIGIVLPADDRKLRKVWVEAGYYSLAMISLIGSCTNPRPRAPERLGGRRLRAAPAVGGHHPDGPEFQAGVVVTIGDITYQVQVPVTDEIAAWVEAWHLARPNAAGGFSVNNPNGAVRRFRMDQAARCLQALWRARRDRLRIRAAEPAAAEAQGANAPDAPAVTELNVRAIPWAPCLRQLPRWMWSNRTIHGKVFAVCPASGWWFRHETEEVGPPEWLIAFATDKSART